MGLLEIIAIVSSGISLSGALGQLGARVWQELLLPIAMLGATSGIALALLGEGALWMAGGVSLVSVGALDASFAELLAHASGVAARASARSVATKQHLTGFASAVAMACFIAA